jgi:S-adenosylmethionine-diacylgycerolhomoserine-N-methlytransferase
MRYQININDQNKALQHYYKLHSRIYDATRWSFLFGRKAIVEQLAAQTEPQRILEVGCGTGKNLALLAKRFPKAHITGVDVSSDMLSVAKHKLAHLGNRVTLLDHPYPLMPCEDSRSRTPQFNHQKYDVILFAYALSMFNPGWDAAITAAIDDLNDGGTLAVVDFHRTPFVVFRRWMGVNHVRMEGHLLPVLERYTDSPRHEIHRAYGGVWEYVLFSGRKPESNSTSCMSDRPGGKLRQ